MIFLWNDANVEHIGTHGVTPGEAEHVAEHARSPWPQKSAEGKYVVWGRTFTGRYLQVIFIYPEDDEIGMQCVTRSQVYAWIEEGEDVVYIIHARDLENSEKKQYRKRRRAQ